MTRYARAEPSNEYPYSFVPREMLEDAELRVFTDPYPATDTFLWCMEQFGPAGIRWIVRYGRFMFSRQTDATAFRVRWG